MVNLRTIPFPLHHFSIKKEALSFISITKQNKGLNLIAYTIVVPEIWDLQWQKVSVQIYTLNVISLVFSSNKKGSKVGFTTTISDDPE